MVVEANEDNFDAEVIRCTLPVLVDFWAPWCGPCRVVTPGLAQIASSYKGLAKVVKVNTDQNRGLVQRFGVRGIPMVMLVHGGQILEKAVGIRPKEEYMRLLDRAIASPAVD